MAVSLKKLIVQSKTRQARLSAIKRIINNIPKKAPVYDFYEDNYYNGIEQGRAIGRAELAAELRKELNKVPFAPAYQPGNTENGHAK